ncbi:transporter [Dechloromonas denitrificans]|uniref:Transporter n=1 Tax=Dechloromonas denitrificans TaxID=281362 RepID=A0A133XIL8_9RHOO|nr:sodium-dependent transporter [Dechloromonas denitrificans]KXB30794.1 transporter [Dechloromonas denitrificans]
METANVNRSHWSSRWAFILVTAGSAIGLGNIWKFPYMTGTNGGSAFVLVYLLCIVSIGLPLLMAETMLGRRGQGNPVAAMGVVAREAGLGRYWKIIGLIGVTGALLILSFYSVVAGWILEYTLRATAGFDGITKESAAAGFAGLLADPLRLIAWHSLFMVMTVFVVARGVTGGIEQANKIMMPALFAIVLGLIGYGMVTADMPAAFRFMFHFDVSAITREVVFSAMGHSFFTLSLGMGAIMAYGSYLDKGTSIVRTCFYVAIADTAIALLAGLAIFAIVFAKGLAPASGPGLILQTLPIAFSQMPGGVVVGPLFFLLVVFAAWTSSISLLEPFVALLIERFAFSRKRAAWATGGAVWLLGIAVALSFNEWSEVKLFGLGIFDLLDSLTTKIMMPLSGLLIAVFAGWMMQRRHVEDEIALGGKGFALWRMTLRYVSPIAIVAIFLHVIGVVG